MKNRPFGVAVFLIISGVFSYYAFIWKDLAGFVRAIDHTDLLFGDFALYFLPQAAEMLNPAPEAIYGYFYSAFFSLLLLPFNFISGQAALWVWGILQIAFFVLLVCRPWNGAHGFAKDNFRPASYYYLFLCLTSLPVLNNFKWGQISVMLTVSVFGAFYLYRSGYSVWAGILLAFSAAIKYYTGIFALIFLFKFDRRALTAFALAFFVFFVLIPAAIFGPKEWFRFQMQSLDNIALADERWMPDDVNSQYIVSVGIRNIYQPSEKISPRLNALLKYGGLLVVALNVLVVWFLRKSNDYDLQISALFIAIPFFLQTSWLHYFVFLPFAQTALIFRFIYKPSKRRWLAAFPVLSAILSSIFLYNFISDWQIYSSTGWIFIANALLIPPLYWQLIAHSTTDH